MANQPVSLRNNRLLRNIIRQTGALVLTMLLTPLADLAQPARQPSQPPQADGTAVADLQRSIQAAIATAEPCVVAISRIPAPKPVADERVLGDSFIQLRPDESPRDAAQIVGAGVIIDPGGLVLTQYLAVSPGEQHFITTTKRQTYAATIRAADARSGLAVLTINAEGLPQRDGKSTSEAVSPEKKFPAIQFGDANSLRKGEFVISIGNPYAIKSDGQPSASWGIITNLAQRAPSGSNLNDSPGLNNDFRTKLHHLGTLIQTDAKLGWSASGGALINLRGELIGLTTTLATIAGHEQPAGYAIPMNVAFRRIVDTLKEGREVEYGMLGVGFGMQQTAAVSGVGSRLTVMQVYPGTPAAKAGLESGDAILQVDGKPVTSVDEVQLAVSLLPPAATTNIAYSRKGVPSTATLAVAKLAAAGRNIVTVRPPAWHGMRVDYATALNARELAQAVSSGTYDPQGCVLVTDVEQGSDAWKAGVRPGMFASHVGNQRVKTPAEFSAAATHASSVSDLQFTKPLSPTSDEHETPKSADGVKK